MDYQMKMTDALIKHKKRKNINYQKEHMDLRDIISMPVKVKCSCEINIASRDVKFCEAQM